MTEEQTLLDPTSEISPVKRPRRARSASLGGRRFGLLDINKARGDVFLDRLDALLKAHGHTVNRYRKARFSIVAPIELKQRIVSQCDIVVEALAD